MPDVVQLIRVFEEARRLVSQGTNDFSYSSWIDTEQAVGEIDSVLSTLHQATIPSVMDVLFAPTGPMQELSLSSGWGSEFVELADRYDAARNACVCFCNAGQLSFQRSIGFDADLSEVTLLNCEKCGQTWLRLQNENEGFPRSGQWYLTSITDQDADGLAPNDARPLIEAQPGYFYGGSYFSGRSGVTNGTLALGGRG